MRITTVRIIVQIVIFALFLTFCLATTFRVVDEHHGQTWVSKFLEVDPLVGIATALATGTVYKGLAWGLVILIPTLLLGRIFCNWICPYGILHQFTGWVFNTRAAKERIDSNRYRGLFAIKYFILIAMLVALLGQLSLSFLVVGAVVGVFGAIIALAIVGTIKEKTAQRRTLVATAVIGVIITCIGARAITKGDWNGTLQIGLLDPICLLHRSFTAAVLPALNMPGVVQSGVPGVVAGVGDQKQHIGSWLIGFMLLALVSANLFIPRFFCRVLCPLGAMLGTLSRFALWRIERDPNKCTDCDLCLQSCEGASDPHTQLRKSECFVCFNCIEDCPHDAISFKFLPARHHEVTSPDLRLRTGVLAAVTGFLFYPFARAGGKSTKDFSASNLVRPPGSCEEFEFLERCIKCDQCIRACPTNVLQPYPLDLNNIESLWTPVMNFRMGFCQLHCTACGEVCPTGAIQRIGLEKKLGLGDYAAAGPVVLGTAHYDLGRCLPWSMKKPCVVCEEVCPTSPKAIYSERMQFVERDGKTLVRSATWSTVTVSGLPKPGEFEPEPIVFRANQFRGDGTTTYQVELIHKNGVHETHEIKRNDADVIEIVGEFDQLPQAGEFAVIRYEWKVPKIDTQYCIGCGICEHECPVVGDRRAVYVTAEGESRSSKEPNRDRNRGLSLIKTADAGGGTRRDVLMELSNMIAAGSPMAVSRGGSSRDGERGERGGCCNGADGGSDGCGCASGRSKGGSKPARARPLSDGRSPAVDLRSFLG